ncbi:hypothetical protein OIU78_010986 [Salix suchowensis]|nr:hypothetical protein OIU78_010986 [Salix suchowensis]
MFQHLEAGTGTVICLSLSASNQPGKQACFVTVIQKIVISMLPVISMRMMKKRRRPRAKEEKREQSWEVRSDVKESPSPPPMPTPKPVDEDLYKISPELLYAKRKKKGVLCLFSSCLMPTCVL